MEDNNTFSQPKKKKKIGENTSLSPCVDTQKREKGALRRVRRQNSQ